MCFFFFRFLVLLAQKRCIYLYFELLIFRCFLFIICIYILRSWWLLSVCQRFVSLDAPCAPYVVRQVVFLARFGVFGRFYYHNVLLAIFSYYSIVFRNSINILSDLPVSSIQRRQFYGNAILWHCHQVFHYPARSLRFWAVIYLLNIFYTSIRLFRVA